MKPTLFFVSAFLILAFSAALPATAQQHFSGHAIRSYRWSASGTKLTLHVAKGGYMKQLFTNGRKIVIKLAPVHKKTMR